MSEFTAAQEEELVLGLYDREIIKFGEFTLKSGRKSPIYYNQRPLLAVDFNHESMDLDNQLRVADLAVEAMAQETNRLNDKLSPEHVYGIPQAATALGAVIANKIGKSYLWGRVGKKDYGKHEGIEGFFHPGESVIQLDDVITNADSKLDSADALEAAGLSTGGFVVMFDRQEGGAGVVEAAGYDFESVTNLSRAAKILIENDRIGAEEIESLQAYHEGLVAEGVASTFSL